MQEKLTKAFEGIFADMRRNKARTGSRLASCFLLGRT